MIEKINFTDFKYSNFVGTSDEFLDELSRAVKVFETPSGVCWIIVRDNIYYLEYCVNDFSVLQNFLNNNAELICKTNALLEIFSSEENFTKKYPELFTRLLEMNFSIESYHKAYVKDYFKNLNDTSENIRVLGQRDLSSLECFFTNIGGNYKYLTFDYVCQFINNADYGLHGYFSNNELLGIIVINFDKNVEKIGFISFLAVKNIELLKFSEENQAIATELVKSALNVFADKDYHKAFIWNDFNLELIRKSITDFGFKPLQKENIVFTRLVVSRVKDEYGR